MKTKEALRKKQIYEAIILFLTFIACMIPRYSQTHFLKLHIGIMVSVYSLLVFLMRIVTLRINKVRIPKEETTFIILLLAVIAGLPRSIELNDWLHYLVYVSGMLFYYQLVMRVKSDDFPRKLAITLVVALCVHLAIGLFEITAHSYLFPTGEIARRLYGNVPISIFRNMNDYATFVATMLPFSIHFFLSEKKPAVRVIAALISGISMLFVIKSECRGAILTVIACLATFMFLLSNNRRYQSFAVFIILGAVLIIVFNSSVRQTALRILQNNSINAESASDSTRINLIRNGLYYLQQTYGFGVGPGNLHYYFDHDTIYNIGKIRYMHNWYVELLVTFGVVVFILYMIFHLKTLGSLYKYSKSDHSLFGLKTAFFLSWFSFSIVCISSSTNVYSEWVWMYIGLITAVRTIIRNTLICHKRNPDEIKR